MITVDKKFYENGCTMEGKGNRVILNEREGTKYAEMIFRNDGMVEIKRFIEDGTEYSAAIKFSDINGITANCAGEPKVYVDRFALNIQ